MELRQLRYFVKTAETLNFSEAARSLFITQSTLSQQIKQLENEFGTDLFERNSHSVTLTENGEKLLPLARRTLIDAEDCNNQIRDLQNILTGELNIGITYSFSPMLNETIRDFMVKYSGVKINIFCKTMEELMGMLKRREIDFVLAYKPDESYDEIESHALFKDKLSVIMRIDHPLASKDHITVNDLKGQKLALPSKGQQARQAIDKNIDMEKEGLDVRIELNEANLLLNLVESSHFITLLSEASIYSRSDLKAMPLEIASNQMTGCIHIHREIYRKRSAEVFLKMLSESTEVCARVNRWL